MRLTRLLADLPRIVNITHLNPSIKRPLQVTAQNYSFEVIPITWRNRRHGIAKLKIREMGSRYLFIVLYLWLEKYFSRGDCRKNLSLS